MLTINEILDLIQTGKINESNLDSKDLMKIQFYTEKLNEEVDDYKKWKKNNVTLRGIKEFGKVNNVYGSYGKGLYTVPLGNKSMAKQYGTVYFVVNAIPKNPKIVNSINEAETWFQLLINDYCSKYDPKYEKPFYNVRFFNANTTYEQEMLNLGFDGFIIKGREMVNYTPSDIRYFRTEDELKDYYDRL